MKNKILVASMLIGLVSIFYSTQLNAQTKFGPLAGVNFTDITGDVDSDGLLIGFHFGALVNFGITDYFMIEPQVMYSIRGAKGKVENLDMNYLEIPVWIRYQLNSGLNFNVGPYAAIVLSAKSGDTSVKDNFKSTDFGLAGGLGYQLRSGLGFAANYGQGITNIGKHGIDATNTCIRITLSYTIGGRRE